MKACERCSISYAVVSVGAVAGAIVCFVIGEAIAGALLVGSALASSWFSDLRNERHQ